MASGALVVDAVVGFGWYYVEEARASGGRCESGVVSGWCPLAAKKPYIRTPIGTAASDDMWFRKP